MTEPRKPQDHKAKAVPDKKPDGWELLKPFADVPVWDQTDLIAIVQPLMASERKEGEEVDMASFDLRLIGELAKRLKDFAVDEDAYVRFVSGPGALERAMNLGMAYVELLGE